MNAEIYVIGFNKKQKTEVSEQLLKVAAALKSLDVHIVYKTEIEPDSERLIQGINQSFLPTENIDLLIIPNAVGAFPEDSLVYRTLCSITAKEDAQGKTYANGVALKQEDNTLCGYCFYHHEGKKVVLLPQATQKELVDTALTAVEAALKTNEIPSDKLSAFGIPFSGQVQHMDIEEKEAMGQVKSEETISKDAERIYKELISEKPEFAEELSENVIEPSDAEKQVNLLEATEVKTGEVKAMAKAKKKKAGFRRTFIPMKGDSGKEVIRKIILDIAVLVFIVAAVWLLFVTVINPYLNDKKYEEIKDPNYKIEVTNPDTGEVVKTLSHDWKKLKDINKEIVAWLKIADTKIDYPVLYHKGDTEKSQFYLYKDMYKDYSIHGSIFVDFRSEKGANSKNVILHGHNMLDGSMFQNLINYGAQSGFAGNLDYYKENPTIRFDTPESDQTYKIISIYKTNTREEHGEFFNYMTGEFNSDAEFMNFVYLSRERSLIDTGVTANENDQLLTLSTCSYEYGDFRTVVVARKVREGESEKVDVSKSKLNPNPLWPDVYYGGNLSAKPKVTTFSKANKAKQIDWYDGKGKLKGKERMFTLYDFEKVATGPATEPQEETNAPTDAPTDAPIVLDQSISFNYSRLDMCVGDSNTLNIFWQPENTYDKSIVWSTDNQHVATIARGGVVTAHNSGTATIKATTKEGNVAVCQIVVTNPIQTVYISQTSHTMKAGERFQLKVTILPENADNQKITWTTDDIWVASVDKNGNVIARNPGSTTITAKLDGITPVSCVVTVTEVQKPESATLE